MADEATTTAPEVPNTSSGASVPAEDLGSAWERAKAAVEAKEAKEGKAPGEDEREAKDAREEPTEGDEGEAEAEAKGDGETDEDDKGDGEKEKGRVTVAERVKWRAEKREAKAKLAAREQELEQKAQELAKREQEALPQSKLRQLRETGDYDELAKLAGAESFNELVQEAARAFASPEYKRIKALEQREREREKQDRERREREEREMAQRRQQEIRTNGVKTLAKELESWDREDVATLAKKDPDFVAYVYDTVAARFRNSDSLSDDEVREEIEDVLEGLMEQTRSRYEAWARAFGDRPADEEDEEATASPPTRAGSKKPARPRKHVSKKKAAEASGRREKLSDAEWIRNAARRLEEAQQAEREAARKSA